MNKVEIRLFGAFRNLTSEESVSFEIKDSPTSEEVRTGLAEYFQSQGTEVDKKLISESVLATEKAVLGLGEVIENGAKLAILPPVCGG